MTRKRKGPTGQGRAKEKDRKSKTYKPNYKLKSAPAQASPEPNEVEKGVPPDNTATLQRSEPEAGGDHREIKPEEARQLCAELVQNPRILDHFAEDLRRSGLVGEERAAKLLYLVLTTRLFEKPVSAVLKGPSSAGKSILMSSVLKFFPTDAYFSRTAMSERAIVYSEEPLKHRFLVIQEAAGLKQGVMAYLVRSLISEGRIDYETVESIEKIGIRSRSIEREGPTGLLVTTTAGSLDTEIETRLFSIPMDDTPEQTRRIILAAAGGSIAEPVDVDCWHALQVWLANGEHHVVIPYDKKLLELIPPVAIRLRRDIPALLRLIEAHALLHRASRDQDEEGRIVASIEDYAVVRELLADLMAEGVGATISCTVRQTVEAVVAVIARKGDVPEGRHALDLENLDTLSASVIEVARYLDLDKSSASRRINRAVELEFLVNRETKRGLPARLVPGDPLPEDRVILPTPEDVDRDS